MPFFFQGIRSDSDLFTYSFPWHPWDGQSIAPGRDIRRYLTDAARTNGIDDKIKFNQHVKEMKWSSQTQSWTISATHTLDDVKTVLKCRFVLQATGYYNYDTPLQAKIPGLEKFNGPVIHPQFWPKEFDYSGKNIVVIGSGATAITLLPSLAKKAAQVTMLQRSPTYIASLTSETRLQALTKLFFPAPISYHLIRLQWILFILFFVRFCRLFPRLSWVVLVFFTSLELPAGASIWPDFAPKYDPFDQNLCLTPNSEFFQALRDGKANIKTATISAVTADTIQLNSDTELKPDVIVTATGLNLQFGGSIDIWVDGTPFSIASSFVWKGCMLDGLPNCVAILGYFDASWTLGTDVSAKMACRLLNHARNKEKNSFTPRSTIGMKKRPFTYLNSTYVTTAEDILPKAGDKAQWLPRANLWRETQDVWWGDIITDMEWL